MSESDGYALEEERYRARIKELEAVVESARALADFLRPGAYRGGSMPTPAELQYGKLFGDLDEKLKALEEG